MTHSTFVHGAFAIESKFREKDVNLPSEVAELSGTVVFDALLTSFRYVGEYKDEGLVKGLRQAIDQATSSLGDFR